MLHFANQDFCMEYGDLTFGVVEEQFKGIGNMPFDCWNIDEWKIMQFTDLKDKTGKEIYEGDIIKTTYHHGCLEIDGEWFPCLSSDLVDKIIEDIYVIKDIFSKCEPKRSMGIENRVKHEIIGNIYENPGLLKCSA